MRIAFRCDTSIKIGSGHFSRCYQLAKVLKFRGHHVVFFSRDLPLHYREILSRDQIFISDIGLISEKETEIDFIKARLTADCIDLLIVDSYEIDEAWEKQVRVPRLKILIIDDLHNRSHDADYLLDQNHIGPQNPYIGLVSKKTLCLLGPKFSLINPIFRLPKGVKSFATPSRVLVFFGGMDHSGATLKYMSTFLRIADDHPVTIVCGSSNPQLEMVKKAIYSTSIRLEVQLPDLFDALLESDLFIGAGGVVTWERCAMGVPSLVISIAQNQEDIANSLAKMRVHNYLGSQELVENVDLFNAFQLLISSPELLNEYSQNSLRIIPESGINNVVEVLGF